MGQRKRNSSVKSVKSPTFDQLLVIRWIRPQQNFVNEKKPIVNIGVCLGYSGVHRNWVQKVRFLSKLHPHSTNRLFQRLSPLIIFHSNSTQKNCYVQNLNRKWSAVRSWFLSNIAALQLSHKQSKQTQCTWMWKLTTRQRPDFGIRCKIWFRSWRTKLNPADWANGLI
jgi:hypothetical protein